MKLIVYFLYKTNDFVYLFFRKFLARLEKRMIFAKYSIEKCYLAHAIASAHLSQSRFDECCSCARKAVEGKNRIHKLNLCKEFLIWGNLFLLLVILETKNCNSIMWHFLSVMLIVKAHAVLHKIERCKEALEEAFNLAQRLQSAKLCSFLEICRAINEQEISLKKRNQSLESVRKRRSPSVASHVSQQSSTGERESQFAKGEENEWRLLLIKLSSAQS